MPLSLHKQASLAAASDSVSLNQFICGVLAAAVEWEPRRGDQGPRERRYPKSRDELARELWGVDVLRD
jgi:HicB-like protein involved in pilus formation